MTTHRAAPVAGESDEGQGTKGRGAPDPSPTVGLVCDSSGGCWTTVQQPPALVRHVIGQHDEDDAAAGYGAELVNVGGDRVTVVAALTLAAEAAGLLRRRAEDVVRSALQDRGPPMTGATQADADTLAAWAEGYAADGWDLLHGAAVVPVVPGTKRAATPRGVLDATGDLDVVRGWWADRYAGHAIGLRPGPGTVVVDLDARHGGPANFRAWRIERGLTLPATLTARTPGGWHLWFTIPTDLPLRGRLPGIEGADVKSHSGYVLAPPSPHPSGGRYAWYRFAPIAPASSWLVNLLRQPEPAPPPAPRGEPPAGLGCIAGPVRAVAEAAPGERNRVLFWASCVLGEHVVASRVALDEGRDALLAAAAEAGLKPVEAARTLRSGLRRVGVAA